MNLSLMRYACVLHFHGSVIPHPTPYQTHKPAQRTIQKCVNAYTVYAYSLRTRIILPACKSAKIHISTHAHVHKNMPIAVEKDTKTLHVIAGKPA